MWAAVTAVVDPKGAKTGAAADTQGANYAVAKAGLEAAAKEVACVDFATALRGKGEPGLLTRLAAPDATSKDPAVADATKKVLYVCSKGRAYQCQTKAAAGVAGAKPGAQDATACLKDGTDDPAKEPKQAAGGAPKWRLVKGAVGRLEPEFEERWPDCLATAPWACKAAGQAPGTCDGTTQKPLAAADAAQSAEFSKRLADAPLATLVELREPVAAAAGKPATTRGSGKFVRGPDLAVVVDRRGALCTNLAGKLRPGKGSTQSADTKVAAAPDALAGYLQAVRDATLDPAARKAWRALAVTTQAGLAKALTGQPATAWPSVRAVVPLLP